MKVTQNYHSSRMHTKFNFVMTIVAILYDLHTYLRFCNYIAKLLQVIIRHQSIMLEILPKMLLGISQKIPLLCFL